MGGDILRSTQLKASFKDSLPVIVTRAKVEHALVEVIGRRGPGAGRGGRAGRVFGGDGAVGDALLPLGEGPDVGAQEATQGVADPLHLT